MCTHLNSWTKTEGREKQRISEKHIIKQVGPGCYVKNKTYLSLMKDKEVFHVHEKEIWLLHLVS